LLAAPSSTRRAIVLTKPLRRGDATIAKMLIALWNYESLAT
jgi:hypothetical protein